MSILPLAVAGGIGYLIGKRPRSYSHYRSNIPSTIDNIICQKLNYMFLAKEMKSINVMRPYQPWNGGYADFRDRHYQPPYRTFADDISNREDEDESSGNDSF